MKLQCLNVATVNASTLDLAGSNRDFAWVIDGAPGSLADVHAASFAETLNKTLHEAAEQDSVHTIRDLLQVAFSQLDQKHRQGAALAVVHDKGDGELDYALVGTVEIHGFHKHGKEIATDPRLTEATRHLHARKNALQRKGNLDTAANEELTTGIINLESTLRKEGFWLADGSPEVVEHMMFGTLDGSLPFVAVTAGFTKTSRQNPLVLINDNPQRVVEDVHQQSGRNSLAALVGLPKMYQA